MPLLFLLSHGTFGRRGEEMYKWNKENGGILEVAETLKKALTLYPAFGLPASGYHHAPSHSHSL